jgi:hypothetical protein
MPVPSGGSIRSRYFAYLSDSDSALMACAQSAADREADDRLVRADHAPGLLGHFVHRAFQRLVPGDGLGRVGRALQGEEVLLHIVFSFELRRDVQRHHKARRLAGVLDGPGHHADREQRAVLPLVPPRPPPLDRIVLQLAGQARVLGFRANIKQRHRQEFGGRVTVAVDGRLVDIEETGGGDIKDPHRHRRRFKQGCITLLALHQRLLGQLALRDVPLYRHPVREPALGVGNRDDVELEPELLAALV